MRPEAWRRIVWPKRTEGNISNSRVMSLVNHRRVAVTEEDLVDIYHQGQIHNLLNRISSNTSSRSMDPGQRREEWGWG